MKKRFGRLIFISIILIILSGSVIAAITGQSQQADYTHLSDAYQGLDPYKASFSDSTWILITLVIGYAVQSLTNRKRDNKNRMAE